MCRPIGNSQRDIVASLSGVAVTKFQDGQIRGIDVAKMIRSLTSGSLAGWQDGQSETTDLTELSTSFQISMARPRPRTSSSPVRWCVSPASALRT